MSLLKSTVQEIRERFDKDVERFSNLETGQSAQIDSPLALELVAVAASATTPHAAAVLDVGCGAGNFNTNRLTGKVALVTGAASGIGKATATLLATEGARVIVGDLNEIAAEHVADAICASGGKARARRLDVTCESDWAAALAELCASWSPLELCVNCAGISFASPLTELSLADWRRVFAVNLDGVFLGTRHAMEIMKAGNGGSIINIASAAGAKALAGNAAYGTSKAAVRFLTRVAALEGSSHHIRVNSISPGAVATPMWEGTPSWPASVAEKNGREAALRALVQDRNMAEALDVARAVLFLASDDARFITGADLTVDGGFSAG